MCATIWSVFRNERSSNDIDFLEGWYLVCYDLRLAADSLLLKLRRLQSDVHRTVGNFLRRTASCDLLVDFITSEPVSARYTVVWAASRSVTKSCE